jgi:hypothetical protein
MPFFWHVAAIRWTRSFAFVPVPRPLIQDSGFFSVQTRITEPSAVAPGQSHSRVRFGEIDPALPRSVLLSSEQLTLIGEDFRLG